MKIKRAVLSNSLGVATVQVDSWRTTYKNIIPQEFLMDMTYENREEKWATIISDQAVFVAETDEGDIIGFSNGGKERTGDYPNYNGELYALYIIKEFQR